MKRDLTALILLIFILTSSFRAFAQRDKGDAYYASYDYKDAISCYQKALKADSADTASLAHIAMCYGILKDYDDAAKYYAKVTSLPSVQPYVYLNYGRILKNDGKLDDARLQFIQYSLLIPSDSAGQAEIRYCDDLKKKFYIPYQVSTVEGINSKYSEFAPVLFNNNLVFMSDRAENMVDIDQNTNTGGNYFKIYEAAPSAKGFEKPEALPEDINGANSDYTIGPISFTPDGKEGFYTQVAAIRKRHFINQAKIYYCMGDGKKWGKPQPFPYNSDKYSVMDPAISADGQMLFFASNMPGGYGGSDIYVCKKMADGSWSKPQNLGKEVNTPGNEAFPYMRSDGTLFFASDRHFNYGGLDIFSCEQVGDLWTDVENLGPDINSSKDDFGICFNNNGRTGYFSSNRDGGTGKDDIYSFIYIGDYSPLKGEVLYSYDTSNTVAGVKISLLNDSGRVMATGITNSAGKFVFTNLDPAKKYIVRIDENDPRFAGKRRFYLADYSGKIVAVTVIDNKMGRYVFTQLPPDISSMPRLDATDKNINLAGNLLQGDSSKPIANARISLLNTSGKVMAYTTTNEFGSFVFTNLPPDNTYMFQVDAQDSKLPPHTRIVLTDRHGNTIKTFMVPGNGKPFRFEILASDTTSIRQMQVEDTQIRFAMKNTLLSDNKTPLANVVVNLVDKNGRILASTTTDARGQFTFTNLPPGSTYLVQMDANDTRLAKMKDIYIADSHLNILQRLHNKNGFKFEVLASDKSNMGSMYVYDPWIDALNLKNRGNSTANRDSLYIIENIYYDYQKWNILPAAARVLDKVVEVMKNDPSIVIELDAYTDPRGTAEFNMQLSQKRADAAVSYIVQHGISALRVKGIGFGETHQLNNCGDPNSHCTEEQYAVNRRTEFKITRRK